MSTTVRLLVLRVHSTFSDVLCHAVVFWVIIGTHVDVCKNIDRTCVRVLLILDFSYMKSTVSICVESRSGFPIPFIRDDFGRLQM